MNYEYSNCPSLPTSSTEQRGTTLSTQHEENDSDFLPSRSNLPKTNKFSCFCSANKSAQAAGFLLVGFSLGSLTIGDPGAKGGSLSIELIVQILIFLAGISVIIATTTTASSDPVVSGMSAAANEPPAAILLKQRNFHYNRHLFWISLVILPLGILWNVYQVIYLLLDFEEPSKNDNYVEQQVYHTPKRIIKLHRLSDEDPNESKTVLPSQNPKSTLTGHILFHGLLLCLLIFTLFFLLVRYLSVQRQRTPPQAAMDDFERSTETTRTNGQTPSSGFY